MFFVRTQKSCHDSIGGEKKGIFHYNFCVYMSSLITHHINTGDQHRRHEPIDTFFRNRKFFTGQMQWQLICVVHGCMLTVSHTLEFTSSKCGYTFNGNGRRWWCAGSLYGNGNVHLVGWCLIVLILFVQLFKQVTSELLNFFFF